MLFKRRFRDVFSFCSKSLIAGEVSVSDEEMLLSVAALKFVNGDAWYQSIIQRIKGGLEQPTTLDDI